MKKMFRKNMLLMAVIILTVLTAGCTKKRPDSVNINDRVTSVSDEHDNIAESDRETENTSSFSENNDTAGENGTEIPTENETGFPEETQTVRPEETVTEPATRVPSVKPTEPSTVKPVEPATSSPAVKPAEPATSSPAVKPAEPATSSPAESETAAPTEPVTSAPSAHIPLIVSGEITTYPEISSYSNITTDDIVRVRNIISGIIYTDMSDLEKIKAVHDYLVVNTKYDTSYYSRSDARNHLYNILNNRIAVCQGYSVAFYVFMNELDIPCSLVSGDAGEPHAWNGVMINGEWYFMDVTWDDPMIKGTSDYKDGSNISYTYFLCTYDKISMTHTADKYAGNTPSQYGTSSEYNEYPYTIMGYSGIFTINSETEADSAIALMTDSGRYIFLLNNDSVSVDAIMEKVDTFIAGKGVSYSCKYGNGSISYDITYN